MEREIENRKVKNKKIKKQKDEITKEKKDKGIPLLFFDLHS